MKVMMKQKMMPSLPTLLLHLPKHPLPMMAALLHIYFRLGLRDLHNPILSLSRKS